MAVLSRSPWDCRAQEISCISTAIVVVATQANRLADKNGPFLQREDGHAEPGQNRASTMLDREIRIFSKLGAWLYVAHEQPQCTRLSTRGISTHHLEI